MTGDGPDQRPLRPSRGAAGLRLLALLAAIVVGGFFAVGSGLSIVFEFQGFGTPADDPRPAVIARQALVLFLALSVPIGLSRMLYPATARWWPVAIGAIAVIAIAAVTLGIVLGTADGGTA